MPHNLSQVFRQYADAWNRREASAIVLTTFAKGGFCAIAMVAIACLVCSTAVNGQALQQNSAMPSLRISELQKKIKTEESAHASAEQLATLWIALADAYEELDLESAEDAFAHAIRLLRETGARDLYANALDGIATVYYASGRTGTAERCLREAVELQHTAGLSTAEISSRRDLAVALVAERKYEDAEQQASEALRLLEAQADPNASEKVVVYLTRSRAICGMRRCKDALQDVDRAEALVSKTGADPVDLITIAALRGEEQFRSGAVEEGERTVQQALRLVESRTDIPAPFRMRLRVRLLEEYSQLLGSAHRKQEKKKVEEEIARAKAQQPGCNGCKVSAASLGLFQ
jgi:tetratricopeptide (TPR) repeat protein